MSTSKHQHRPKIVDVDVDVGVGRAGDKQVAGALEKAVGVVAVEQG